MSSTRDIGTSSHAVSDSADDSLLREIAHAPSHRPPLTIADQTAWGAEERYLIEGRLGHGGMGTVYAALDRVLDRRVALKVLDSVESDADPLTRESLRREARTAARVEHARVARIYDVDTHEGVDFVAMELVRGRTLRDHMRGRPLQAREIIDIATQIAEGLAALHANGVIHRDLKPENVMVAEGGDVKLLDFGLARVSSIPQAERTSGVTSRAERATLRSMSGTPGYMAPEQCLGAAMDERADVFAFGIILFEMVTGRRPFRGETLPAIMKATVENPPSFERREWSRVPKRLARITQRMLEKEPERRLANGGTTLSELRPLSPAAHGFTRVATRVIAASLLITVLVALVWTGARRALHARALARALAAPPPVGMALVRGGNIKMGASAEEQEKLCADIGTDCDRERLFWSVPASQVMVAPFYMDIHEATNAQLVDMLNGIRASLFVAPDDDTHVPRFVRYNSGLGHDGETLLDLFDSTTGIEFVPDMSQSVEAFRARSGRERWPVTQVTLFGARRFCESRGKRLPTEEEWEAAARGTEDRPYPWGAAPINCGGVHVPRDGNSVFAAACDTTAIAEAPGDVGTSPQDVTPDGIHDLGGNVGEWTDTIFLRDAPPGAPDQELPRVIRGGSFLISLAAHTSIRSRQPPTAAGINGGFRCVRSLALN